MCEYLRSSCSPQGLTLDSAAQTTNLQMMVTSLGIPAAPVLKPPSERFTLVSLQSDWFLMTSVMMSPQRITT